MYDPLVRAVIEALNLAERRLGEHHEALGSDPDARLVDAIQRYLAAYNVTYASEVERARKQRERDRSPRR